MSDLGLDPMQDAKEELGKVARRLRRRAIDWFKAHATWALVKVTILGLVAAVAIAMRFQWLIGAFAGVAFAALIVYCVFLTRKLRRMDAERRWNWVGMQRLKQENIRAEAEIDQATRLLLGDRGSIGRVRSQQLREAIGYVRSRYALEQAEQRRLPTSPSHRPAPPIKQPDTAPIIRRLERRKAEIAEAEARIQSYADRDSVDRAMEAEAATRTRRQIQDDAIAADRAARENARRGRTASPASAGIAMQIKVGLNGSRNARTGTPPPTPEQIASGRTGDRMELTEGAS